MLVERKPHRATHPTTKAKPAKNEDIIFFDLVMPQFHTLYRASPVLLHDLVKKGVPAVFISTISTEMASSRDRVIELLGMSRSTVMGKIKHNKNLPTEEGERAIGLARLIGMVADLVNTSGNDPDFDAAKWVGAWIDKPNAALGRKKPAELLDTSSGQEAVANLIRQSVAGVYA